MKIGENGGSRERAGIDPLEFHANPTVREATQISALFLGLDPELLAECPRRYFQSYRIYARLG